MNKKDVKKILDILEKEHKEARVMLIYKNALQLLVSTILSAQCTDERVNMVTKELFKKYKTAKDFADTEQSILEEEIKTTGFYKNKARNIINCCKMLIEKFNSEVPDNINDLTSLPGVGRKTANIILANVYSKPAIAVDTHVARVSQKIGFTKSDNPDKIEEDLCRIIPENKWIKATKVINFHGRKICIARKPKCEICKIREYCDFFDKSY